jgi:iron complex outermembrane receptor protein
MRRIYTNGYIFLCVMLMLPILSVAQTGSISGKVLDENNEPLPGASIIVKEVKKGTTTDVNGNFRLSGLPNDELAVSVSFIGYITLQKTISVNGETTIDFKLQPSAQALDAVVVVGYGTTTRRDVTGSISTVSEDDFQKGVISTPEQLITGKVAGVSITSNNGAPGAGSTIRIRGGASLNASNNPLIVVDGVPLSDNGISGASNPLSLINPNDIESVTVLKDASAAAIYGSRASNGVILITTKKGTTGAPQVNFSSQFSTANATKMVDVLSPEEFRAFINENGTPNCFLRKR